MKKIFFTFLTITIAIQGYSQTSQQYFHDLRNYFGSLNIESVEIRNRFMDLAQYSSWNSGEHQNMGQGNLANNWNNIGARFHDLEMHFNFIRDYFMMSESKFHEIGNLLGNFDGTYGSLSGLPSLFDGSFSSLSGTPTTLAGYGITDSGLKYVTEGDNTGVRLSSANAANHGDIGNTAVDLSYQSSASTTTGATGQSSFAVGLDSTASGASSISGGYLTIASGDASVALGNGAQAAGTYSYSIGHLSKANGDNSVALGFFNESDGQHATSMGKSTKASGNSSTSIGDSTTASGVTATAMGESTTASGYVSLALGKNTTSSAEQSIAAGYGSIAEGNRSTALGLYSKASGTSSTAMGLHTVSESPSSLVIGTWNELNSGDEQTLFVIGNGGWDATRENYLGTEESRSNALKVLVDGTTTIAGSVTASSFIGDGSGLTSLPLVVESITEGGNTGVRLSSANAANHGDIGNTAVDLSYQSSASTTTGATGQSSFAVGLDSTASGASSISGGYLTIASGDASVALGNGAQAAGTYSYSIGHLSKANGDNSVALGFFNESDGQHATSMGKSTKASGNSSTSIGDSTTASGVTATAMGESTTASGYVSLALGKNTTSSAEQSIAAGYGSIAEGNRSTALGLYSKASGTSSTAMGLHTVSESPSSLVIGTWNELNSGDEQTLFVIGNGGWDATRENYLGTEESRSNALKVLVDGTTTIAGDLSINSDARLKANIVSLGATLSKLLQIDGKSYTMKKDKREKQKIGLLAQDIEKVFPELVSESNGIKSVNYQGLVPVLINALKEQDVFMKEQQRILSVQQSELDELKSMMKKIIER